MMSADVQRARRACGRCMLAPGGLRALVGLVAGVYPAAARRARSRGRPAPRMSVLARRAARRWPRMWEAVGMGLAAIRAYKMRAALTILGVVMGIMTVTGMSSHRGRPQQVDGQPDREPGLGRRVRAVPGVPART